MAEPSLCSVCGSVLPANWPKGLCSRCALQAALEMTGESPVEQSVVPPEQNPSAALARIEKPSDRIGRYKLLQQIGEGGCGIVYMAEQEEPVRRRVALKVIKLGMDTKQVIGRFEAERQALAMMDHPNIAKVLDAGATETGRPYFVMELVKGVKITDYCDQNHLPTQERLKLFIQVCQAIQHAHQKGIIHRDIKPSNILVTLHDGVAVPKVIDFGIAKAIEQRLTDKTVFTAYKEFIGTPAYVSPEQAEMSGLDIDTRTDIYSLGVLLYELLTGQTPFNAEQWVKAGLDEIRRTIREVEPLRPSTRLSTMLEGELTVTAKHRQTEGLKLIHLVKGDLDWIVMKTLEKERTRRYETANGLATDAQRHLNNEPVVARPPSNLYRFQKAVQRNKVAFAATAAIVIVLVLGVMVSTWQAFRATRAEREQARLRQEAEAARTQAETNEKRAETEASRSARVAQFMRDMLEGIEPDVSLGRDTTLLRHILDRTQRRLNELKGQPEVESYLRDTFGHVYLSLCEYTNAEAMFREALHLQQKAMHRNEHPSVAALLDSLSVTLRAQDKFSEAEKLTRDALMMQRKLLGNDHTDVGWSLLHLSVILRIHERWPEAQSLAREAQAIFSKQPGGDEVHVASSLSHLGTALLGEGRLSEAEEHYRQVIALLRRLYGDDHRWVASEVMHLGRTLSLEGRHGEAEPMLREALATQRRHLSGRHMELSYTLEFLADLLVKLDQLEEAERCYLEAIDIRRKIGGLGAYAPIDGLVALLRHQGRLPDAEAVLREALPAVGTPSNEGLAQESFRGAVTLHHLADVLREENKLDEACSYAEAAVSSFQRHPDWPPTERQHAFTVLGDVRQASGDRVGMVRLHREYLKSLRVTRPPDDPVLADAIAQLTIALLSEGQPAEAEPLAHECLAIFENCRPDDWRTFNSRSLLGGSLLGQKNYTDAEPLLTSGYKGMKLRETRIPIEGKVRLKEALERIVQLYEVTSRTAAAAEWKQHLAELDSRKR